MFHLHRIIYDHMLNFDKQNEYVFIYKIYGGGNNILKGYFDYVNTSNFEIKDFPTEQRHISQLNVVSRGNDYFFSYINVEKKTKSIKYLYFYVSSCRFLQS